MKKSINTFQARQGDVLIEAISALPKGLKKAKNNTLAMGESANHGHFVFGAEVMEDEEGTLFISVEEEAQLKHLLADSGIWTQEHQPIAIPKGIYQVVQQTEYDPYKNAVRNVQD